MKRRNFLKSIMGAAVVPLIPMKHEEIPAFKPMEKSLWVQVKGPVMANIDAGNYVWIQDSSGSVICFDRELLPEEIEYFYHNSYRLIKAGQYDNTYLA